MRERSNVFLSFSVYACLLPCKCMKKDTVCIKTNVEKFLQAFFFAYLCNAVKILWHKHLFYH